MSTGMKGQPRRKAPPGEHGRWVHPDLAAEALGCSSRTIRRRCLEGSLRCFNWGTGWVVAADELEPDRRAEHSAGDHREIRGVEVVQAATPSASVPQKWQPAVREPTRAVVGPPRRLPEPAAPVGQVEPVEEPAVF